MKQYLFLTVLCLPFFQPIHAADDANLPPAQVKLHAESPISLPNLEKRYGTTERRFSTTDLKGNKTDIIVWDDSPSLEVLATQRDGQIVSVSISKRSASGLSFNVPRINADEVLKLFADGQTWMAQPASKGLDEYNRDLLFRSDGSLYAFAGMGDVTFCTPEEFQRKHPDFKPVIKDATPSSEPAQQRAPEKSPEANKPSPRPTAADALIAKSDKTELRQWFCEFATGSKTETKSYLKDGGIAATVIHTKLQKQTPGEYLAVGFEFISNEARLSFIAGTKAVLLKTSDKQTIPLEGILPIYTKTPKNVANPEEASWMRIGKVAIQPLGGEFSTDDLEFWPTGGFDPIDACIPLRQPGEKGKLVRRIVYLFKLTPEQAAALKEKTLAFTLVGISDSAIVKTASKLSKAPIHLTLKDGEAVPVSFPSRPDAAGEKPVSGAPSTTASKWPVSTGELRGSMEVRVRNPNDFSVKVGLRSDGKGKDFSVGANGVQSVHVPNGSYDIYFQYSTDPDGLYQGDGFTLKNNGVEIQIVKVVNGNYGIRKVK